MVMLTLRFFRFLLSLGILVLGANGQQQNYTVTIVANPNMATYTVGDTLILTCMVDPMPSSAVTYSWDCSDCFADGMTTQNITRDLTDMDNVVIDCSARIDDVEYMTEMMFDLQVTQAPSIISFNPIQEEMVGNLLTIECRVDTVAGVNSLMINWTGPGGVAISNSTRMTIGPTTRSGNTYTSSLQFTYLMEGDEGNYTCNVMILDTTGSQSIELLPLNIPSPTVRATAPNTQTVGQSLTLQCEMTTARGITSRVDIVWSSGGMVLMRTNDTTATTMDNSLVYTDSYTISQLSTTDDGRVIQCEVVINASPPVMASDSTTLDVNVPTPAVTVSPSDPIQGAMVGSPQVINCTVSTVSGVESSSIMISWTEPGGVAINNNTRVTIGPTTPSGNTYTSSLRFTYLMEGDEGTYTCNTMILDISESQSVELRALTIPSPAVRATAPNTQTVGQSLTLQCEVTTVRGITSRVDIVWRSGTELRRMNDVSSTTMDNSLVYTDTYTISQLSTTDDDRVIRCEVVINASPPVMASDSITLDVTEVPSSSEISTIMTTSTSITMVTTSSVTSTSATATDATTPTPSASTPTPSASDGGGSDSDVGTIIGIILAIIVGVLLIILVILIIIVVIRNRNNRQGFYPTNEGKGGEEMILKYSASLRSITRTGAGAGGTENGGTINKTTKKEQEYYI